MTNPNGEIILAKERLAKAEIMKEGIFFLIHLFARNILVMKKLDFEKTKPSFIITVLKVEYKVVLVSAISNVSTNKTSLANKWMSFSSSNLALEDTTSEGFFSYFIE